MAESAYYVPRDDGRIGVMGGMQEALLDELFGVFHRDERADAEPVLPGWSMPVDELFPPS